MEHTPFTAQIVAAHGRKLDEYQRILDLRGGGVQARGNSSQVEVFGPLTSESLGGRINSDIDRWKGGDNSCGESA